MSQDLLNKNKYKTSKGQSLTEILLAVLFFGIIAVALSLPASNSLYLNYDNKNLTSANALARSYLKDIQDEWKLQADFDLGTMVPVDSIYTNNGEYTVTTSVQDLHTDADGNVLLRRVNIIYKDNNNNTLCDLYYDYNRPGSV